MDESEWMVCREPRLLLRHFRRGMGGDVWTRWLQRPELSPRKWRLFACACARRIWGWLHAVFRELVEMSERIAECQLTQAEWKIAEKEYRVLWLRGGGGEYHSGNAACATFTGGADIAQGAGHARRVVAWKAGARIPRKDKQAGRRVALTLKLRGSAILFEISSAIPSVLLPCVKPGRLPPWSSYLRRLTKNALCLLAFWTPTALTFLPMPWKMLAAQIPRFSITCADRDRTFADALRWICCSARIDFSPAIALQSPDCRILK